MTEFGVVFMTASSPAEAEKIAEALVSKKLAACVNVLPGLRSFYWWQDQICRDDEIMMMAKIKKQDFEALVQAVLDLHSYDVPEIILLPLEAGSKSYLDWIQQVTG